jgi:hypothetical protein
VGPSKAKVREKIPSLVKQKKGVDEGRVGSPMKIPTTFQKQKGKKKSS